MIGISRAESAHQYGPATVGAAPRPRRDSAEATTGARPRRHGSRGRGPAPTDFDPAGSAASGGSGPTAATRPSRNNRWAIVRGNLAVAGMTRSHRLRSGMVGRFLWERPHGRDATQSRQPPALERGDMAVAAWARSHRLRSGWVGCFRWERPHGRDGPLPRGRYTRRMSADERDAGFQLAAPYQPAGDQPQAIDALVA